MTEGCALLGCHSRSGRARSSILVHGQPGSCSLWSLVCIEYETESEASEGHVELQSRSDRICQFWGSNVQQSWGPIGDGRGGRRLSHREGCWRNRLACRWKHGSEFGWLMMWASAEPCVFGEAGSSMTGRVWWYDLSWSTLDRWRNRDSSRMWVQLGTEVDCGADLYLSWQDCASCQAKWIESCQCKERAGSRTSTRELSQ